MSFPPLSQEQEDTTDEVAISNRFPQREASDAGNPDDGCQPWRQKSPAESRIRFKQPKRRKIVDAGGRYLADFREA